MSREKHHIDNSYLRYANCWEDADVLIEGLQPEKDDRILSIGSGGDNSFSLLVEQPEIVVAVDINPNQLKLIELKKAGFKALNYTEFLEFLGFRDSTKRLELFEKVSNFLRDENKSYWEQKILEIKYGLINQGKFEKYFQSFSKKVLPKIHSKKKIKTLFSIKSEVEQQIFFEKKWNTWRWRMLFRVFFSKYVMGKFGRDPKFLTQVSIPVSTYILNKAKSHLSSTNCQSNFYLEYILTGKFGENLPHYARPENFESIKENIERLIVFEGFAEDAFKKFHSFNKFNLSNIFEYMDEELFKSTSKNIIENSDKNSRFVYWNLMVERKMSSIDDKLVTKKNKRLQKTDKGFFYKELIIETK